MYEMRERKRNHFHFSTIMDNDISLFLYIFDINDVDHNLVKKYLLCGKRQREKWFHQIVMQMIHCIVFSGWNVVAVLPYINTHLVSCVSQQFNLLSLKQHVHPHNSCLITILTLHLRKYFRIFPSIRSHFLRFCDWYWWWIVNQLLRLSSLST